MTSIYPPYTFLQFEFKLCMFSDKIDNRFFIVIISTLSSLIKTPSYQIFSALPQPEHNHPIKTVEVKIIKQKQERLKFFEIENLTTQLNTELIQKVDFKIDYFNRLLLENDYE